MNRKLTWVYTALLAAVLLVNFVMLRRLDASERRRQASRAEYREFRESLVVLIAKNDVKHNELTAELRRLKAEFADANKRIGYINSVIPVQAMRDRAEQR